MPNAAPSVGSVVSFSMRPGKTHRETISSPIAESQATTNNAVLTLPED